MKTYFFPFTLVFALVAGLSLSAETGPELITSPGSSALVNRILSSHACLRDRIKAAHRLGDSLNPNELDRLLDFVAAHAGADETNLAGLRLLKNEVLTALREQEALPARLGNALIGVYQDQAQDPIVRDYAIQHLVLWGQQGAYANTANSRCIRDLLFEAAGKKDTISGTALIGIYRLDLLYNGCNDTMLQAAAVSIIRGHDFPTAAKIAAIQVCAGCDFFAALPAIKEIAKSEQQTAIGISAMAAVSRLNAMHRSMSFDQAEKTSTIGSHPVAAWQRTEAAATYNSATSQLLH